jgi:hypothetical protein
MSFKMEGTKAITSKNQVEIVTLAITVRRTRKTVSQWMEMMWLVFFLFFYSFGCFAPWWTSPLLRMVNRTTHAVTALEQSRIMNAPGGSGGQSHTRLQLAACGALLRLFVSEEGFSIGGKMVSFSKNQYRAIPMVVKKNMPLRDWPTDAADHGPDVLGYMVDLQGRIPNTGSHCIGARNRTMCFASSGLGRVSRRKVARRDGGWMAT